jgi:hypothetical protein
MSLDSYPFIDSFVTVTVIRRKPRNIKYGLSSYFQDMESQISEL